MACILHDFNNSSCGMYLLWLVILWYADMLQKLYAVFGSIVVVGVLTCRESYMLCLVVLW